jgi:hypothetical protein
MGTLKTTASYLTTLWDNNVNTALKERIRTSVAEYCSVAKQFHHAMERNIPNNLMKQECITYLDGFRAPLGQTTGQNLVTARTRTKISVGTIKDLHGSGPELGFLGVFLKDPQ